MFLLSAGAAGGNQSADAEDEDKKLDGGGNTGEDAAQKQAELNRQFTERAERAGKSERRKFLDALGLKDEAEFEAYVKAKKEADDAQKTELQKQTDAALAEKVRADKLEAESRVQIEAANARVVNGEIKLLASQPVTDKDGKVVRSAFRADALDDVAVLIDRKEIKDEDGKIVGVDKALEALAKSKPWMLAEAQPQSKQAAKGTPAPGSGNGAQDKKENQTATTPKLTL
jgi:hypothetical protein